ncbi:hypothetical protein, partial [Rhizobium sp. Root483D2]|uniref:hypothetical protein n=1 Tax=Rhizobium sp. Root483D2 TaxID=1736545 RepID=UPI00138F5D72
MFEQQARASGDAANALEITGLQSSLVDAQGDITSLASGVSALETNVTNLEDGVAAQAQALTALEADVDGKASADALSQLTAEVLAIGSGVVSQSEAVTAVRNSLFPLASEMLDQDFANFLGDQKGLEATARAEQSLTTRIESNQSSLEIVAQALTLVQAALPGKAEATAVETLSSRVTATESSLVAQ